MSDEELERAFAVLEDGGNVPVTIYFSEVQLVMRELVKMMREMRAAKQQPMPSQAEAVARAMNADH